MILNPDALQADCAPYGPVLYRRAQAVLARNDTRRRALGDLLQRLPQTRPSVTALDQDRVAIGQTTDLDAPQRALMQEILQGLKPWRKGPFDIFGIQLDSEWDSSLKWRRLAPHMAPIQGHRVLDVGSSNGYYLFRMAGAHPRLVLGIEPYLNYYFQFLALQHLLQVPGLHSLPLKLEELPDMKQWFDTVFCMGILYHRRSPLDTLVRMKDLMAKGGQLILETLIIEGEGDMALSPRQRYARMRNVYFIPTVRCLDNWLSRSGFANIRCVDVTPTTAAEQRNTRWIDSDSLETFLDPQDPGRTVEGYPAPIRAVLIAEKA